MLATPATANRPASQAQVDYIRLLATQKATRQPTPAEIATWDRAKASTIISWYLTHDFTGADARIATATAKATVPDGHYALDHDGDIRFYAVRTDTEGRWAGIPLVTRFRSDEEDALKGAHRREVLGRIAADPAAASKLYGLETVRCGVCNRKLTVQASRDLGIGPVCAGKMGW